MWPVVRLILTALLAFSVQAQGVAATRSVGCDAEHPRHAGMATESHAHGSGDGIRRSAQVDDVEPSGHAHGVVSPAVPDANPLFDSGGHKCSACGSCCVNAAVATDFIRVDSIDARERFGPLATGSLVAHLTEGIERPPRVLA